MIRPSISTVSRDGTWLVALAAALWGTDALLRQPLVSDISAATIVVAEHAIIVLILLPWIPRALRALRAAPLRTQAAVIVIGGGSSALATNLFTLAFIHGGPITPLVLQKLQPVIAVAAAALLLRERITWRFPLFAVPALIGAWLLSFDDPTRIALADLQAAALALGAAALWAAGTVLGRLAGADLAARDITVLRFTLGLPAAILIAMIVGAPLTTSLGNVPALVALALVPGLIALTIYYRGLRTTAASRATFAELAFPVTAAAIGVGLLDDRLSTTQWLGFAVVLVSVCALAVHERRSTTPAVTAPALVSG